MKSRDIVYIVGILFLIIGFVTYTIKYSTGKHDIPVIKTDTVTYVDTVTYHKPIPKDSIVVRYKTVVLPTTKSDTNSTERDGTIVQIPITQKEYEDSTYHIWVSGYCAELDSVKVFPKTTVVTSTLMKADWRKTKRWGVGVQVGYGFNGRDFAPYIGVGVTYNLFSW